MDKSNLKDLSKIMKLDNKLRAEFTLFARNIQTMNVI